MHSFATLFEELANIARDTCRAPRVGPDAPRFNVMTTPDSKQRRALELIQHIEL